MSPAAKSALPGFFEKHESKLVQSWLAEQKNTQKSGQAEDKDLADQSKRFVAALREGSEKGSVENISSDHWAAARGVLEEVSRSRANKGFSPTETATFVFSLKAPLFEMLTREAKDPETLAREVWNATQLLDRFGLYTTEIFQKTREEVILRQQEELMELSTPVVQLWQGILALPLIGTLDSSRTQVVMENLLEEIVRTGASIAIIDITGVPTVDTLVAQHLLKTISAARLMGADCLISGIRPQIAQTIVHLGVELNVISKATMADAFALALKRIGKTVSDRKEVQRKSASLQQSDAQTG
jgi:rsbT co-antagonist protein RsbR